MSRWFRHYAGMMRDEKLVTAAIRSKQPVERVLWVWGAILESAAEVNDNGRYEVDNAEMAYFLRADQGDVDAITDALASLGRVCDGAVVNWGERQFQSDRSMERQRRYRDRQKGNGDGTKNECDVTPPSPTVTVTVPSRHGDAPYTETDTESEKKEKKEPAPSARPSKVDEEKELFRRGREVLGTNSGGLVKRILLAKANNLALARAVIETASTKDNPREWIGGVVRNATEKDPESAKKLFLAEMDEFYRGVL